MSAHDMTAGTVMYLPLDTSARALGADQVADALVSECAARNALITIVRTGSRGLFWLEPMLEIQTRQGRMAFGPLLPGEVPDLLAQGLLRGDAMGHRKCLGLVEQLPWFQQQQRLTTLRLGVIDPVSIDSYEAHGGFKGLARALVMTCQELVDLIKASGLRGRGGAAFPTGVKWQTVLDTQAEQKYIVCNADEGDSGTFADRMLMEGDPFSLIEGMIIAGLATGASRGYIYLREEYPQACQVLNSAVSAARVEDYLGDSILGSGRGFELEVRLGAGSYVCGEETALLESLQGERGMVRVKPPVPAVKGLFGKPTVINNVVTLAAVPGIVSQGARHYADYGSGQSRGTMTFQLAGNVARGGLVELPFGTSLRELIEDFGGGTRSGRPVRAVQVGGPLGAYLPESQWDTPLDYEAFDAIDAVLGHGGVVVFDDTVDMLAQARYAMAFCAAESCGKCTPCRIGSMRGMELLDRIKAQTQADGLILLEALCDTLEHGSLCAMGGMTPYPVRSAVKYFGEDFAR